MGYLSLKLDSQDQGVPISNPRTLGGFASVSRFVTYDYGDSPHNCKPGFGYFAENELANHWFCSHNNGMKIKLTAEQKQKMNQIFELIDDLSSDKKFMKQLQWANKQYDVDNMDDDTAELSCFTENLIDTVKCSFNYYDI
jgi:hypothetical protein